LDEPNWGVIHVYMETSQWNPLYNCYILIKMFEKEKADYHRKKSLKFSHLGQSLNSFSIDCWLAGILYKLTFLSFSFPRRLLWQLEIILNS
jgi:hypothetical protein